MTSRSEKQRARIRWRTAALPALILDLLLVVLPLGAAADPLLHEFFVLDESMEGATRPTPGLTPEPVHTAGGPENPGGSHPGRPGARNAPLPGEDGLGLDRDTDREGWLTYFAVFDPTVAPFKRVGVRDRVVVERGEVRLTVSDPDPRRLRLTGGAAPESDEAFVGEVLVDFEPDVYVPIPSVSADMVVHRYQVEPTVGVEFYRDAADNVLIRADHEGQVRLRYWVSGPRAYFGGPWPMAGGPDDVPAELRPEVPPAVRLTALRARLLLGVPEGAPIVDTVSALAQYFRGFRAEVYPREEWTEDIYRDILMGGRGVCRHRAFAFVVTLQSWGIPARYVYNEAHAFAEVFLPGVGWRRVDLGGGAAGLNVMNASTRPLHAPPGEDPLPRPEPFDEGYSQQVDEELAERGTVRGGSEGPMSLPGEAIEMTEWDPFAQSEVDIESLPENRPWNGQTPRPRRSTAIEVGDTPAEVFRGDTLPLTVMLEDVDRGEPLPGRELRVYLGPPSGVEEGRILELGRFRTDARGAVEEAVSIPQSLPLGVWGVYVVFAGDDEHAPSRTP